MAFWSRGVVRWSVWWSLLALLTWALLSPQPPRVAQALLPEEMTFSASKAVHICAYAFLTLLVLWLPATRQQRVALWLVLASHAVLTEVGQTFVPGRHGSIYDVGINLLGLSLGLVVSYLLTRSSQPTTLEPRSPSVPGSSVAVATTSPSQQ